MTHFQPILYPGETKQYSGMMMQYVKINTLDEYVMQEMISEWIEENHEDPMEELSPEIFAFDLSDIKIVFDDSPFAMLEDSAVNDYVDLRWVGIYDELYRPRSHDFAYHPWILYHVSEV